MIARAEQIAAQRFPDLQGAMPRVVVCQAFDFPNRAIGGRFSSGTVPTIEIPEYSLSNDLNNILAHETPFKRPEARCSGQQWRNGHHRWLVGKVSDRKVVLRDTRNALSSSNTG